VKNTCLGEGGVHKAWLKSEIPSTFSCLNVYPGINTWWQDPHKQKLCVSYLPLNQCYTNSHLLLSIMLIEVSHLRFRCENYRDPIHTGKSEFGPERLWVKTGCCEYVVGTVYNKWGRCVFIIYFPSLVKQYKIEKKKESSDLLREKKNINFQVASQ